MSRPGEIYVSKDVLKSLLLIAKALNAGLDDQARAERATAITADEVADRMLRHAIREKYPLTFQHQKEVDTLEKQLIENLLKK